MSSVPLPVSLGLARGYALRVFASAFACPLSGVLRDWALVDGAGCALRVTREGAVRVRDAGGRRTFRSARKLALAAVSSPVAVSALADPEAPFAERLEVVLRNCDTTDECLANLTWGFGVPSSQRPRLGRRAAPRPVAVEESAAVIPLPASLGLARGYALRLLPAVVACPTTHVLRDWELLGPAGRPLAVQRGGRVSVWREDGRRTLVSARKLALSAVSARDDPAWWPDPAKECRCVDDSHDERLESLEWTATGARARPISARRRIRSDGTRRQGVAINYAHELEQREVRAKAPIAEPPRDAGPPLVIAAPPALPAPPRGRPPKRPRNSPAESPRNSPPGSPSDV